MRLIHTVALIVFHSGFLLLSHASPAPKISPPLQCKSSKPSPPSFQKEVNRRRELHLYSFDAADRNPHSLSHSFVNSSSRHSHLILTLFTRHGKTPTNLFPVFQCPLMSQRREERESDRKEVKGKEDKNTNHEPFLLIVLLSLRTCSMSPCCHPCCM